MKIGILTMNYRRNYGGILQCVALQNTLREWGHEVEVIRYTSNNTKGIRRKLKILFADFSFMTISHYIYNVFSDCINRCTGKQKPLPKLLLEKCARFVSENINYTELCNENTIGTLVERHKYDLIIVGSDKIWGGLAYSQLVYMGDWEPQYNGKLISYAACSSQSHLPKFNVKKIQSLLIRFSAISVRDEHTKSLFNGLSNIKPQIVLDPTFLYDFKKYIQPYEGEAYIFTYILGREIKGGHDSVLNKIKGKYGNLKVKAIVLSDESTDIVQYADEVFYEATPDDWINMIHHASFIYTDSFHGIVFSLKYQKPFLAYYQEINRATRLIDLRNRFSLEKQIVSSFDEIINSDLVEPKFDIINPKISSMINYSKQYLINEIDEK